MIEHTLPGQGQERHIHSRSRTDLAEPTTEDKVLGMDMMQYWLGEYRFMVLCWS